MPVTDDDLIRQMQAASGVSTKKKIPLVPPMTLQRATAIAQRKNPLMTLPQGQTGLGVQADINARKQLPAGPLQTAVNSLSAKNEAAISHDPVVNSTEDFLTKASNTMEVPLTILGGTMLDMERQRQRGKNPWDADQAGPTEANLRKLLLSGHFGEAADRYSTTSLQANRARAEAGDVGAQYLDKHPTLFGALGFGEEVANPSNAVVGEGARLAGGLIKSGIRGIGKGVVGAATRWGGKNAASNAFVRYAHAADEGPLNRFAEVRKAAHDVASRPLPLQPIKPSSRVLNGKALNPAPRLALPPGEPAKALTGEVPKPLAKEAPLKPLQIPGGKMDPAKAADAAERISTNLVNSPKYTEALNDGVVMQVFGGTSPEEQFEAVHRYETGGATRPPTANPQLPIPERPALPGGKKFDAAAEARINNAVTQMKNFFPTFDDWQKYRNLLSEGRQLRSTPFFPRGGMYTDEELNNEEERLTQATHDMSSSRGGLNVRKGSAGENAGHRTHETMREARASGKMDPEATPSQAFLDYLNQRHLNLQIEERMHEFGQLGLVSDMKKPGFKKWTDISSVKNFGSPYLKEKYVHPVVARLIEDTMGQLSNDHGLTGFPKAADNFLKFTNRAASRLLTAFWGYHGLVNLPQTALAKMASLADNPKAWSAFMRELATSEKLPEAMKIGATLPHAPSLKAGIRSIPWAARSAAQKRASILSIPAHISSDPLYGRIKLPGGKEVAGPEQRIGSALYQGLRAAGVPDDRAMIEVREALGGQEQLPPNSPWAQMLQFPLWFRAMQVMWPKALALAPALYNAPHRAIAARNLSRGSSVTPYSERSFATSLFPPIATGQDKNGDTDFLQLASPANAPLEAMNIAGNALTGNEVVDGTGQREAALVLLESHLNPVLGTMARAEGRPTDRDLTRELRENAPPKGPLATALATIGGGVERYLPIRTNQQGVQPVSGFGIDTYSDLSDDRAKLRARIEENALQGDRVRGRYMPGIEYYRSAAIKAQQTGDKASADQLSAEADQLWQGMLDELQANNLPAPQL